MKVPGRPTLVRAALLAVPLLTLVTCVDDLQVLGPGKRLSAPAGPLKARPGELGAVVVQVLDANAEGVDGARVTFVRSDAARLVWTEAAEESEAISVLSDTGDALGLVGRGIAHGAFRVPSAASPGTTHIVAVLEQAHETGPTIYKRLSLEISGAGGSGGSSNDTSSAEPTPGDGSESSESETP